MWPSCRKPMFKCDGLQAKEFLLSKVELSLWRKPPTVHLGLCSLRPDRTIYHKACTKQLDSLERLAHSDSGPDPIMSKQDLLTTLFSKELRILPLSQATALKFPISMIILTHSSKKFEYFKTQMEEKKCFVLEDWASPLLKTP